MKFLILISALFVLASSNSVGNNNAWRRSHFAQDNVTELIQSEGYPVQNFTVETSDGYIIDVIRIPGPADYKRQFAHQLDQSRTGQIKTGKPVVLLMHSLLGSSEEFVIGGAEQGLAYYLANAGFDVFLGNSRGNDYARKHTKLNPEKDAAFWKFCWQDIGKKDLPAMIDDILQMTGEEKLYYVGFMQGSTAFYVLASEWPEYNKKIEKMISLGPQAYLGHTKNAMLRYISENQASVSVRKNTYLFAIDLLVWLNDTTGKNAIWQMKNLGLNEFKPSETLVSNGGQQKCLSQGLPQDLCTNSYFLINGFDSQNYNMTTVKNILSRVPSGASTKQIAHYASLAKSGRFEKYRPNVNQANEEYDLGKITTPVVLIYAADDGVSQVEDIKKLKNKLPNVVEDIKLTQLNNNMDLIYGKNANNVHKTIIDTLKAR